MTCGIRYRKVMFPAVIFMCWLTMLKSGIMTSILPVLIIIKPYLVPTRQKDRHASYRPIGILCLCRASFDTCTMRKCKASVKQAIRNSYHRALVVRSLCKSCRLANWIAGVWDFHFPGKLFRTFGKLGREGVFSNSFNVFFQESPI